MDQIEIPNLITTDMVLASKLTQKGEKYRREIPSIFSH